MPASAASKKGNATADDLAYLGLLGANPALMLHQRPAYQVRPPGLFRHIGYHFDLPYQDGQKEGSDRWARDRRASVLRELNESLIGIQACMGLSPEQYMSFHHDPPSTAGANESAIGRKVPASETILVRLRPPEGDFSHWRLRLRVDFHSEYFFITFAIDQSEASSAAPVGTSAARLRAAEADCAIGNGPDPHAFCEEFFTSFWRNLHNKLLNDAALKTLAEARRAANPMDPLPIFPGRFFADIRGVVLGDRNSPFLKMAGPPSAAMPPMVLDKSHTPKLEKARASLLAWVNRNRHLIARIAQLPVDNANADKSAGAVICEMLDGGAILVSSLGRSDLFRELPDPEYNAAPQRIEPTHYLVLYNNFSYDQLGRLVRRLHVLCELCIASLLGYRALNDAHWKIRAIGINIDNALKTGKQGKDFDTEKFHEELNAINVSVQPGGLVYRINRSRYYARAYRKRLKDLRIRRLEGWEPYDEYIRRNIYQVYDFIDNLGTRHEALSNRLNRLTLASNAHRLQNVVNEIENIQQFGEWIGIMAVVYYGGHVVADFLHFISKLISPLAATMPAWPAFILERLHASFGDHDGHKLLFDIAGYTIAIIVVGLIKIAWRSKHPLTGEPSANGKVK